MELKKMFGTLLVPCAAVFAISVFPCAAHSGLSDLEGSLKKNRIPISRQGSSKGDIRLTLSQHEENLAYVKSLYRELLGRDLDIDGEATWVGGMDVGKFTRVDIRNNVLNSPEYQLKKTLDARRNAMFPKKGTVVNTEIGLNVRTGSWGTIIGGLSDGDAVTIVGEDGDWYKINYNGQTAYVYKEYISAGGPAASNTSDDSQNHNPPAEDSTPTISSVSGSRDASGALAVPLIGQPDGYTCGPTSLAMALKYFGIEKSIHPDLVNMCKCNTAGTASVDYLVSTAKSLGLSGSYSRSGNLDWLKQVTDSGKPVIANVQGMAWSGGHYLVVTGVSDGKVYINDPAWGPNNEKGHSGNKLVMDINTFSSLWSGHYNLAAVIDK